AVPDDALVADMHELARAEGLSSAPEGAATLAALRALLQQGTLMPDERIVLFNTGAAWKYAELYPPAEFPVLDPDAPTVLDQIA
ncbi:MAG: threonine synthase, partial [Chloroflexota bacterium]